MLRLWRCLHGERAEDVALICRPPDAMAAGIDRTGGHDRSAAEE